MYNRQTQLLFKLNQTMPRTEEYFAVLKELFEDRLGEGSYVSLIARTPVSFPVKGRKRVNKSFDCGNRPDNIIFHDYKEENNLFDSLWRCFLVCNA